jgi:hypothetical protein
MAQFVLSINIFSKIDFFNRSLTRKNSFKYLNSKECNSKEKNEFQKNVNRENDLVPQPKPLTTRWASCSFARLEHGGHF